MTPTGPTDDTLERGHLAFYKRMRKDRVGLAILGTVLSDVPTDPAPVFEELQRFAQRLGSAAARFEAAEIRDAAHALEIAAQYAASARADEAERRVWAALTSLAGLLAAVTSSSVPG
jgi:hypothetical protein